MHKTLYSLLVLAAALTPTPIFAQTGAPRLQAYDHCIRLQIERQVSGARRSVSGPEQERIAQVALDQCQMLLPGAVIDYKLLAMSLVRGSAYEARAASATANEWREKVISSRTSMARGMVSSATAPPPRPDRSSY